MKSPFLFISILLSTTVNAQQSGQSYIDSLLHSIPFCKDDTVKARTYNKIFNELITVNLKQAAAIARTGLVHTQQMKWAKGIGVFQNNLGRYYGQYGNYDSAVFYYHASLATHQKAGNKKEMGVCYNNLGVLAQNSKGDYTSAAEYYFKALHWAQDTKDSIAQANALNNLGAIYMLQKDYARSLEFNKKALRIRELINDLEQVSISLQSIGKTYLLLKDSTKAKQFFIKGLNMSEANADIAGMAAGWANLSLAYSTDYNAIAEARLKAKQLWDQANPIHPEAISNLGNLGIIYFDIATKDSLKKVKYNTHIPTDRIALLSQAGAYLNAAIQLAQKTGDIDNLSFFTGALAEVQEQQADFKNAYYNYKFYKETEDSIYSQESKNKIAAAESRRTVELQQLAISNQRKAMWGLIGGITLISIIGFLLYRQAKARKKLNQRLTVLNKELEEANQAKARFFALMSHDLRSPVARLIHFLHLQKNEPHLLTAELKEIHNKKIREGAEALLENMEAMLLWSKSQMEQFKPSLKKLLVNELFEKLNRSFAGHEHIEFKFYNDSNMVLTTDENYIFSILHNLIQNATEAIKTIPAAIIECNAIEKDGHYYFTVKDNGPGFPQHLLDAGNTNTVLSGNKGLGLFMIHEMAVAINGNIRLSNTGDGAIAMLTIAL